MFLGEETGTKVAGCHGPADLVAANNVFAHVPDIVDFATGLRALVADNGRVTIEIRTCCGSSRATSTTRSTTSTTPTSLCSRPSGCSPTPA